MLFMPLILSHRSALEFYRLSDEGFIASLPRVREVESVSCAVPDGSCSVKVSNLGIDMPVSVINNSTTRLLNSAQFEYRRFATVPPDALLKLEDELFVCSPELVFLQLAGSLSLIELICLGYELCGVYPDEGSGRSGVLCREPLTAASRITGVLSRCPGAYHIAKARRAAAYVIDGSASPMETALCMRLSLPYNLGGYGIPRPSLNYRIDFTSHIGADLGRSFCVCDLMCPTSV